ncbi:MAG: TolB family protein [Mariprofundus sp.]
MKTKLLWIGTFSLLLTASPIWAASNYGRSADEPLYPVSPLIVKKGVDSVYPSVAGDFMVIETYHDGEFRVERLSKNSPDTTSRSVKTMVIREAIRFGVAIKDGSVGFVSNRTGPLSAWMWTGYGESYAAIGHMGGFRGNVPPYHLNGTPDGKTWCYDTTLQKMRQNELLSEFSKHSYTELLGQLWRIYDSNNFIRRQGYAATKTGNKNKLKPPVLYVYNRQPMQLNMIPNAFDGTLSPDGRKVVFVRETNGNYDLWMQTVDGSELVQLTDSPFGDFEPQFSPDGSKLLFVSNRDYEGTVTRTSIYMMDMKNFAITRLTNARNAVDGGPAWLDDNTIVFHSDRNPAKPQSGTISGWNIWQLKLN